MQANLILLSGLFQKFSALGFWDHSGNLVVLCMEDPGILRGTESLGAPDAADLGNISAEEDK